jgi:hypothetical protein
LALGGWLLAFGGWLLAFGLSLPKIGCPENRKNKYS